MMKIKKPGWYGYVRDSGGLLLFNIIEITKEKLIYWEHIDIMLSPINKVFYYFDSEFSMWTNSEAARQLKPIKKLPRIEKEIAIKIALTPRIGY